MIHITYRKIAIFSMFTMLFIFACVYSTLNNSDFSIRGEPVSSGLNFSDSFWLSISTQTLLGAGDILPITRRATTALTFQTFFTFGILLWIFTTPDLSKPIYTFNK